MNLTSEVTLSFNSYVWFLKYEQMKLPFLKPKGKLKQKELSPLMHCETLILNTKNLVVKFREKARDYCEV